MKKLKASLIHLLISSVICLPIFYLIYFIWYPTPLLEMQGVGKLSILFLIGTVALGPILTFIIFKPGKKGLIFDIITIIIIQILVLSYGTYHFYLERPLYAAFNVDRFNLVTISDITPQEVQNKLLEVSPFEKTKLIYIEMPEDPVKRMTITMEALSGGKDFVQRPMFYRPYAPFTHLIISSTYQLSQKAIMQRYSKEIQHLGNLTQNIPFIFYPIQGKKNDRIIVLKSNNAEFIEIITADPWGLPPGK